MGRKAPSRLCNRGNFPISLLDGVIEGWKRDSFYLPIFFLLDAAWVRSRAERPSVSYTKVTSKVAWTGHNLQFTKTNSNNKLAAARKYEKKGGREDETDARAVRSDPLARRIE